MSAQEKMTKEAEKTFKNFLEQAYHGKTVKGYNKAINAIGNNFFGGAEYVGRVLDGQGLAESLYNTFSKGGESAVKEIDGKLSNANGWNIGKIAGSYMGVAAAGRVLSGGGVTRDSSGSPNLIGIPFV